MPDIIYGWLRNEMTQSVANSENRMTEPEEKCPGCGSLENRRVSIDLDCPRFMQGDQLMACMGCGNAVRFECRTPDEDGDLLEDGCGWWFQTPLHPEASISGSMGSEPTWNVHKY